MEGQPSQKALDVWKGVFAVLPDGMLPAGFFPIRPLHLCATYAKPGCASPLFLWCVNIVVRGILTLGGSWAFYSHFGLGGSWPFILTLGGSSSWVRVRVSNRALQREVGWPWSSRLLWSEHRGYFKLIQICLGPSKTTHCAVIFPTHHLASLSKCPTTTKIVPARSPIFSASCPMTGFMR